MNRAVRGAALAIAGLVFVVMAGAMVWHTVRMELIFWGASPSSMTVAGDEEALHGRIVREVLLVEGVGREDQQFTLTPGVWRVTVEAMDATVDEARLSSTGERNSTSMWNLDYPLVFTVEEFSRAKFTHGSELAIRVNTLEDDVEWSVTLERFAEPVWP